MPDCMRRCCLLRQCGRPLGLGDHPVPVALLPVQCEIATAGLCGARAVRRTVDSGCNARSWCACRPARSTCSSADAELHVAPLPKRADHSLAAFRFCDRPFQGKSPWPGSRARRSCCAFDRRCECIRHWRADLLRVGQRRMQQRATAIKPPARQQTPSPATITTLRGLLNIGSPVAYRRVRPVEATRKTL